jgi:hypothetical protein
MERLLAQLEAMTTEDERRSSAIRIVVRNNRLSGLNRSGSSA